MKTILLHLKKGKKADMISILDTSENNDTYDALGYVKYLSPSEGSFDASPYTDISEYGDEHKNLKRNLKRRRDVVETEVLWGPVPGKDKEEIRDCLDCSIENSRVFTQSQMVCSES